MPVSCSPSTEREVLQNPNSKISSLKEVKDSRNLITEKKKERDSERERVSFRICPGLYILPPIVQALGMEFSI